MGSNPPAPPPDNSSNSRKIAVPALAGALSILAVIAGHTVRLPISDADYSIGAPALAVVLAALLDVVIPDRFLA